MKAIRFGIVTLGLVSAHLSSADITLTTIEERVSILKNTSVWSAPKWLNADFTFNDELNIVSGPTTSGNDEVFRASDFFCTTTQDLLTNKGNSGMTPKFFCQLMGKNSENSQGSDELKLLTKKNGEMDTVKVKYESDEVQSEVVGTRLLWALGFAADSNYLIERTHCFGCDSDPFRSKKLNPETLKTPHVFSPTTVERKYKGTEILYTGPVDVELHRKGSSHADQLELSNEGWTFAELLALTSDNKEVKRQQLTERDALKLLAIFMRHADAKPANHRLVCERGGVDEATGKCVGKAIAIIQDIGTSFGKGVDISILKMSKFDLAKWKAINVWKDAKRCRGQLFNFKDPTLNDPLISEEGRAFIAKLLKNFIDGEKGRERVADLFRAARVELRGDSVNDWTDAFIYKAEQVIYPMGKDKPDFKCPRSIESVL